MSSVGQNRDRAKRYELNGESHTLREWSKISGVAVHKLYNRLRKGYTLEEAMSTNVDLRLRPLENKGNAVNRYAKRMLRYEYQGEMYTVTELAKLTGIASNRLRQRLRVEHHTVEEAVSELKGEAYRTYNRERMRKEDSNT